VLIRSVARKTVEPRGNRPGWLACAPVNIGGWPEAGRLAPWPGAAGLSLNSRPLDAVWDEPLRALCGVPRRSGRQAWCQMGQRKDSAAALSTAGGAAHGWSASDRASASGLLTVQGGNAGANPQEDRRTAQADGAAGCPQSRWRRLHCLMVGGR